MSENGLSENPLVSFGDAVEAAKNGHRITREGWNGVGMFAYYVPAGEYPAQTEVALQNIGETVKYRAYLALKTAQGDVAMWSPSGTDVLEEDWIIL